MAGALEMEHHSIRLPFLCQLPIIHPLVDLFLVFAAIATSAEVPKQYTLQVAVRLNIRQKYPTTPPTTTQRVPISSAADTIESRELYIHSTANAIAI